MLLAAARHSRALDLPHPSVEAILAATGAARTRAYELGDALLATLPSLQRPVGRPPAPPPPTRAEAALELRGAVLTFLGEHPGGMHRGPQRHHYTDAFRYFLTRLALLDPERHLRAAVARYPLDVVVDGIAIFETKGRVGTLPAGVTEAQLDGIIDRKLGRRWRVWLMEKWTAPEPATARAQPCARVPAAASAGHGGKESPHGRY